MRYWSRMVRRIGIGAAVMALVPAGVVAASSSTSGAAGVTRSVVSFDGTAGTPANYIFPFTTVSHASVEDIGFFQYYMFRPLYWFGSRDSTTVNKRLSLAKTPVFSDGNKRVKITLKPYKWSDGESVDSTDIMFWMNMWHQKPTGYYGWFPGGLSMPTSLASVTATTPTTITFRFKQSMNRHWLYWNQLSEITPLPLAWTRTSLTAAPGSAGCAKATYGTNDPACKAVYQFLSEQAGFNPTKPSQTLNALPTYATNPLWKVVDGPFTLKTFTPTGPFTMVPNPSYSGPNKPKIKEYIDKTYTTMGAEYNALASGTLDIGQLPPTEITSSAAKAGRAGVAPVTGKNNPRLAATYTMAPFYLWGVNYFPYNFKSTGDTGNAGPIFRQLYFRQAVQHLVDQTLYVSRIDKGYGESIYGPVPNLPKSPMLSNAELENPYPFSVSAARQLLKRHGWKVVPNGTSTCQKPGTGPGKCGAGIKKGAKLDFTLQYLSGTKTISTLMQAEKSNWEQMGMHVNLLTATFDTVIGNAVPCPKGCSWELENWGAGWEFYPDLYPAGTSILAAGASSNFGDWSTRTSTALIAKTVRGSTNLFKYENWEEKQLPVIWQPQRVTLYEVHKGLTGVLPTNPLNTETPATYAWKR